MHADGVEPEEPVAGEEVAAWGDKDGVGEGWEGEDEEREEEERFHIVRRRRRQCQVSSFVVNECVVKLFERGVRKFVLVTGNWWFLRSD